LDYNPVLVCDDVPRWTLQPEFGKPFLTLGLTIFNPENFVVSNIGCNFATEI
jgi:hypothetical protein